MEIQINNQDYKDFIYNKVLPSMGLKNLTNSNIDDVYDYIVENYEIAYIETKNPKLKFIDNLLAYLAQFMDFVE
ncbi:MAG: hypothetical protein ACI4TT_03400 [Christensenellales bacterium]